MQDAVSEWLAAARYRFLAGYPRSVIDLVGPAGVEFARNAEYLRPGLKPEVCPVSRGHRRALWCRRWHGGAWTRRALMSRPGGFLRHRTCARSRAVIYEPGVPFVVKAPSIVSSVRSTLDIPACMFQ
jgi:hypothetical protein